MTAEDVRAFRISQKLSKPALARALGCPVLSVEEWEAGKYKPPPMLRLACAAIAASLMPWSRSALPVEIAIEATSQSMSGLVAQIVSLRQAGYEPSNLILASGLWHDLARSSLATPFEHLVIDLPGRRELAGVVIELDVDAGAPSFTCHRSR